MLDVEIGINLQNNAIDQVKLFAVHLNITELNTAKTNMKLTIPQIVDRFQSTVFYDVYFKYGESVMNVIKGIKKTLPEEELRELSDDQVSIIENIISKYRVKAENISYRYGNVYALKSKEYNELMQYIDDNFQVFLSTYEVIDNIHYMTFVTDNIDETFLMMYYLIKNKKDITVDIVNTKTDKIGDITMKIM